MSREGTDTELALRKGAVKEEEVTSIFSPL
jgi:hypothetical protein